MVLYNFKTIAVVPSSSDFIDITLSKTQRKTPTVIHNGYAISRIRKFYMRKVKYTQENFHEKLHTILSEFPRLDDIHPFYGDLINVLYSRDHYKLALGQLNTAKSLIDNIGKDYLKLLKFADSLYRAKELKRAALGRMCTLITKLKPSLAYLEQVRQHLSRLPSIDPNTRTLLITGKPNTGKSSFLNLVTNANVEVQPYAFTTKSLFVGHVDYQYVRWQVIDTPGILDHSLEERNVIEMQAITALAHLHATVLYFMDLSGQCGYSIEQQVSLFHNIKPLFANKPLLIICNKSDLTKLDDLEAGQRQLVEGLTAGSNGRVQLLSMSNMTTDGVSSVMQAGCDLLLAHRVEKKLSNSKRVTEVMNRISVAQPIKRDDKPRPVSIPSSVLQRRKLLASRMSDEEALAQKSAAGPLFSRDFRASLHRPVLDPLTGERKRTERDREAEAGGAGVYSFDLRRQYALNVDEWKWDVIPEIMDGKNVADYIDVDVEKQLALLEAEEEEEMRRFKERNEAEMDDADSELEEEQKQQAAVIREKKLLVKAARVLRRTNNKPVLPRSVRARHTALEAVGQTLDSMGLDSERMRERSRSRSRSRVRVDDDAEAGAGRGRKRARDEDGELMDVEPSAKQRAVSAIRERSKSRDRSSSHRVNVVSPFKDVVEKKKAGRLSVVQGQRQANRAARVGECDRRHYDEKPKHLYSGKRGMGKTDRR